MFRYLLCLGTCVSISVPGMLPFISDYLVRNCDLLWLNSTPF